MPIIDAGVRLTRLYELRDQVDAEIAEAEARRKDLRADALKRQKAAEVAERRREVEAIEAAAPAELVRAWATEHGLEVGARGRLPLELRKQYLADQGGPS